MTFLTVDKAEIPTDSRQEEDRQKNLAFLLEKVEGCSVQHAKKNNKIYFWIGFIALFFVSQSVFEVAGRYLVHSGDLVELDSENFLPLQKNSFETVIDVWEAKK